MGASTGYPFLFNCITAAGTGFACFLINLEAVLVGAGPAIEILVVLYGSAPVGDSGRHGGTHSLAEGFPFRTSQAAGGSFWMNAGQKQALICVYVANAGRGALIQ